LIEKRALFYTVNHAQIHSWNQSVLSNECKATCSRKQRKSLTGLYSRQAWLEVRLTTHCATTHSGLHVGMQGHKDKCSKELQTLSVLWMEPAWLYTGTMQFSVVKLP